MNSALYKHYSKSNLPRLHSSKKTPLRLLGNVDSYCTICTVSLSRQEQELRDDINSRAADQIVPRHIFYSILVLIAN